MSRVRLNIAALRETRLPMKAPPAETVDSLVALGPDALKVTRREAVAIAGVAAATVANATGAVPAFAALGPVSVTASSKRARFAAGSNALVLDTARFAGAPKLAVTKSATGTVVALSGARFPGTELPADLSFETVGAGAGMRLRIRSRLGGFDAEVPLAKWLAGEAIASSAVRFSGETCPLKGLSAIKLSGSGTATFGPDWTLKIEGSSIARVTGLGSGIVGDTVTIALPSENVPSLFTRRIKRRTLVTIERGTREWTLAAPSGNGAGGVALAKDAFDTITLEAAETADGYPYRAVVATSTGPDAKALFASKALRNSRGRAVEVPLAALRYARAFDADGESFALAADFPEQSSWLHGKGYALLVGSGPGSTPFEMTGTGRVADRVVCRPAVAAVSVPMGDAIVEPIRYPEGSTVALNLGTQKPPARSMRAQAAAIDPGIIDIIDPGVIVLPNASAVTVTRPEDMLRLRFEFSNLSLVTSGTPKLVRRSRTLNTAKLVVVFPPQHILESAYNEFAALPSGSDEGTAKLPIWSTIAGESRLAFALSASQADAGIPYTLAGLLNWDAYDMAVPDAARASATVPQTLVEPTDFETSIEAPWGLYLSPTQYARWTHKADAVGQNNVYELWHTKYVGDYRPIFIALGEEASDRGSATRSAAIGPAIGGAIIGTRPPITDAVRFGLTSPKVRAVWARYYQQRKDNPLTSIIPSVPSELRRRNSFTRSAEVAQDPLGVRNRWTVADLTGRYRKPAVDVRQLMLTSQGAWMNVLGNWATDEYTNPPESLNIIAALLTWEHRMTQGRDHYVKLVFAGRIFPFGHKAVEVQVTERKFRTEPGSSRPVAYLLQRNFIVIREPVRTYDFADYPGKAYRARQMPFKKVEFKTLITPPISTTAAQLSDGVAGMYSYWVRDAVNTTKDIMFQIEATDWDGTLIKFEAPMIFVDENIAVRKLSSTPDSTNLGPVAVAYQGKSIDMRGQVITYAEPLPSGVPKDTRQLPTQWMKFSAETLRPTQVGGGERLFHPRLHLSGVRLDIAEQITNQVASTPINLADVYLNNGYSGPNAKGMAFANVNPKLTSLIPFTPGIIVSMDNDGLPLQFPGSQAGGLATPSQVLKGLSAYAGPFGGAVDAFADGFGDGTDFNPGDFFGSLLEAKLIGGVKLIDLLTSVLGLDDIPGFTKRIEGPEGDKKLIVAFDWNVDNTSTQKIKKALIFEPTSSTKVHLKAEMTKSLSNLEAAPTSIIEGSLSDFYINLIGDDALFMNLVFGTFTMSSINGESPKINPGLEDVLFAGPLEFLNELRQFLGVFGGGGQGAQALAKGSKTEEMALGSFNIGPFLVEFDTAGLFISISLAIPNISVGAMSLSNMTLGAKISLLWDGSPILVDFNFCTKESQMTISVCGWGGGGYVLLKLATGDPFLRMLEIGFWFGASASIDIGVASGSVEIKGGFTFTITDDGSTETLKFEAYIRLSGRLDILGIIKVSLTFELVLTYEQFTKGSDKGDKLTGTATLTIEIEILFFSFSVNATCSQEIAGKDPRFGDTYDESEWIAYCKAFAPATLGA